MRCLEIRPLSAERYSRMDSYVSSHLQKVKSQLMMSQLGKMILIDLHQFFSIIKIRIKPNGMYRTCFNTIEAYSLKWKPLVTYYMLLSTATFNKLYLSVLTVFNDGASKQLLCLGGTIPVHYKGIVISSSSE